MMRSEKIGNLLMKVRRAGKVPASEYLDSGDFPVIDQGDGEIAGYSNEADLVHRAPLPIIIFGDHTRRVKLATKPFISGADGTQLLYPNDETIDPTYFYYAVKNVDLSNYFYARHFKFLKEQYINIPSVEIQRLAADKLRCYDNLIENNGRRITLLEDAARLLYREWFVKRGADEAKNGEIKEEKLDSLVNNLNNMRSGIDAQVRECMEDKYPYYGSASIIDYVDDYIFDGRYLLVGGDGTVKTSYGNPKLQLVEEKFWVNSCAHVLQGASVSTEFLYCALAEYKIEGHITGLAVPHLTRSNLNRILIGVHTNSKVMRKFDHIIKPIFDQILNLQKQSKLLIKSRDLLLPRLMDGRIKP